LIAGNQQLHIGHAYADIGFRTAAGVIEGEHIKDEHRLTASDTTFAQIEGILVTSDERHVYLADLYKQSIRHVDRLTNMVETVDVRSSVGSMYAIAWASASETAFYFSAGTGIWRVELPSQRTIRVHALHEPSVYGLVSTPCGLLIIARKTKLFFLDPVCSIIVEITMHRASHTITKNIFGLALDAKRKCLYVAECGSQSIHVVTLDPRIFVPS
jgi:sugar lactone lactonase YvrE